MAKAVISIENPSPSDWDLVKGIDSKLFQLLSTAGWKLANIDTESVKTFPDEGPAEGIKFETNNMPLISFSRLVVVASELPGIISTTISFTEPVVIQGRAKREEILDQRTGAARVQISTPRLLSEKDLGLTSDNQG